MSTNIPVSVTKNPGRISKRFIQIEIKYRHSLSPDYKIGVSHEEQVKFPFDLAKEFEEFKTKITEEVPVKAFGFVPCIVLGGVELYGKYKFSDPLDDFSIVNIEVTTDFVTIHIEHVNWLGTNSKLDKSFNELCNEVKTHIDLVFLPKLFSHLAVELPQWVASF